MHDRAFRSVTLAAICLLLGGASLGARGAWEPVEEEPSGGQGPVISEEHRVGRFDEVRISSAFQADIRQGSATRVVVKVEQQLLPHVVVRQSGGVLSVSLRPGVRVPRQRPRVEITAPSLRRIELSGASEALVRGLDSDRSVSFELSGASAMAGDVRAGELSVEVSGASSVRLRGECGRLHLDLSGASSAELTELPVRQLSAQLSGASTAAVRAEERLDLEASGASRLFYRGAPEMGSIELSGASSLKSLGS